MKSDKKGLSPVIATVLLIMLGIILFVIILIWVKSFIPPAITKTVGEKAELVDTFCDDISFYADAFYDGGELTISAQNKGNVPIYGLEVKKKGSFSIKRIEDVAFSGDTLLSGDTRETTVVTNQVATGEEILLVPVLLGETESKEKKYYTCDDDFGEKVLIQ